MPRRFVHPYLLRDKLTLTCALILVLASIISSFLIVSYLREESRASLLQKSRVVAEQAARRMTGLVEANRWDEIEEYLANFRDYPEILCIEVFRQNGDLAAGRYFGTLANRPAQPNLHRFTISIPILAHGEKEAFVVFSISLRQLFTTTFRSALFLFAINLFCLFVAVVGIYLMLQKISEPIASLVSTAREVTHSRDFSLRAKKFKNDEIGRLADSFNQMLETVEKQAREIEQQSEQLARAERMEALGVLAGGVAHDLNNLLGPMVAMPSILCEQLAANDPMRSDLALIGDSANRAASVVQDLLSLARREKCIPHPMWLNSLVSECLDSRAVRKLAEADGGVEIVVDLDDSLPAIRGSEPHLMQAILNVALNGIEAMSETGGRMRVSTGLKKVASGTDLLISCPAGDYAALTIEDDGCGIPQDQLKRILEPFYSSKPLGNSGSGLGLAVVYGILHDHRAGLRVDSTVGVGTCFEMYFPISATPPEISVESEPRPGTERVLVVDDVAAQRVLTERLLKSYGYHTDAVSNGRAAVERLRAEDFDAVVLDMIMEEGFDGLDTYREMREIKPSIRCVVSTGHSDSVRVEEMLRLGASGCLRKPFSRVKLCQAVRDALDQAPSEIELVS